MRNKVKTKNTEIRVIKRERERERERDLMYFGTINPTSPAYCNSFAVWDLGPLERKGGKLAFKRKVNRNYN